MDYTNYRDYRIRINDGHIDIMLIIEITKMELIMGHIGNILIIETSKFELTGGHIELY